MTLEMVGLSMGRRTKESYEHVVYWLGTSSLFSVMVRWLVTWGCGIAWVEAVEA